MTYIKLGSKRVDPVQVLDKFDHTAVLWLFVIVAFILLLGFPVLAAFVLDMGVAKAYLFYVLQIATFGSLTALLKYRAYSLVSRKGLK